MLIPLLLATSSLLAYYVYEKLRYKRVIQYADLPQLPRSFLWGHLKAFDEFTKRGRIDRHPDQIFAEMNESIGRPPLMLVDLWPINDPVLLITDHEVAEQICKASKLFPTSIPKTPMPHLVDLTGPKSILSQEGENWRALRKRFNPGFAPQHLMTLLPCILEQTSTFIGLLDTYAASGEEICLVPIIVNLTFDIMGAVLMDVDLKAQNPDPLRRGELIRLYGELIGSFTGDKVNLPWWVQPRTELKRRRLGKRINQLLDDIIREKHSELQAGRAHGANKSRSVLSLSLQSTEELTAESLSETRDQLKTFMFAGHDTTSSTLAWIFWELSRSPNALAAVRAELDDIFGKDTDRAVLQARLLSPAGPESIQRMTYISAVIKEVLRLHPPAGTARMTQPGTGFTLRTPAGQNYCVDGMIIYSCSAIVQRDPAVYGESANDFVPERWLEDVKQVGGSGVPVSAWRPFERGPRNCIGQELANIETRVILAAVARQFDFTKVGIGELDLDSEGMPILDEPGQYVAKSQMYSTRQITAKPVDGMRMKVSLAA